MIITGNNATTKRGFIMSTKVFVFTDKDGDYFYCNQNPVATGAVGLAIWKKAVDEVADGNPVAAFEKRHPLELAMHLRSVKIESDKQKEEASELTLLAEFDYEGAAFDLYES